MAEQMKILVVEPRKHPRVMEIPNTLGDKQAVVDGLIQPVELDDGAIIVCNEEGLFRPDLVYLNLWSDFDPTEMRYTIRKAMYAAGFGMVEESDKGYNQPAYDTATKQYTVQWTWCLPEAV